MNNVSTKSSQTLQEHLRNPEILSLFILIGISFILSVITLFVAPLFIGAILIMTVAGLGFSVVRITLKTLSVERGLILTGSELDAIIKHLKDGVVIYSPNFTILSMNRAGEEIFNVETKDVVGKSIDPSLVKNPKLRTLTQVIFPSLAPTVRQTSEADTWPQIIDISLDEPRLELETTLHRLADQNGKSIGFLKIVRDRTREKTIIESKTEFINVAAHQLRTPLTAMNWALENLKKMAASGSQEMRDLIDQAFQISERSLKITNDLLDASKIEDGKFGYQFKAINLSELIQKVVGAATPIANQYSVRLYIDLKTIPSLEIHADHDRIITALLNLIENSIKYNVKNGKVVITTESSSGAPFVKISVEDSGIGVPEEDLKKVFQKFHRSSNAVQVEPNGTGLGLYITKNIIERHGGIIGFTSTLNRGTTFWFTLPLNPDLIPHKEFV
ncbi:PAS domain-containing protein [Candidatus Jorgensenbacteria bacterium]|nr:PAS domain-containing protein [Candidatus Jorgensenbacteria bacterium]